MKQVIFKNINIENFLSVGSNPPLQLTFKSGLNVITGINKDDNSANGVGKSTILDALYFCLFGTTIRDLKKEQIVNYHVKKNCKVFVQFDVINNTEVNQYLLIRGIEPTKVQLFKNNVDITASSIPKTNEQIENILSLSPSTFVNSVMLTANNTTPFMMQNKTDKRKFIEGIMQLNIFTDMLLKVRQDYNDCRKNADITQTKIDETDKSYKIYLQQKETQQQQKENQIKTLLTRKQNNENEIIQLKNNIITVDVQQITEHKNNISLLQNKISECNKQDKEYIKEITLKESNKNQNKKRLGELDRYGDVCVTCKRPFTDNDKAQYGNEKDKLLAENTAIDEQIIKIKTNTNQLEIIIEKCNKKISQINEQINCINDNIRKNEIILQKVKQIQNNNDQIDKDIQNIKDIKDTYDDILKDTITKLDTLKTELKNINYKLNILDTVKFIVSEEGVKSFITKKILKLLNDKLVFYLHKLKANCSCVFNEYFEETIINNKNQSCSYHNFSGGERKRIDLAILFAFMDIRRLQNNIAINVSFYDEILDSSLDMSGIICLLDIVSERINKYGENTYIITHQPAAVKKLMELNANVINLEKVNGFTKIQDTL